MSISGSLRSSAILLVLLTTACAGTQKQCAAYKASRFGADWIVVQYTQDGRPFHCWKLTGVALDSGTGGNVDWKDPGGHMMHITGWENRVQVVDRDFAGAARLVGVDASRCGEGIYPTPIVDTR